MNVTAEHTDNTEPKGLFFSVILATLVPLLLGTAVAFGQSAIATEKSEAFGEAALIAWSTNRGGPYIPTPVIYRDQLYILGVNGVLTVYDVRTGQRVYQQRVGGGGSFSASPVAADGKLYLSSEDGDVFVLKAGPVYELLASNPIGEVVMATPAISDGLVIIRGVKHVMALGQKP